MKAKDLRGKNIEDLENDASEPKEEEDAVAAAYENISKKLESIRNSKNDDEESDEESESRGKGVEEEVELEEWKGPRPPKLDEIDEDIDEKEIKKATLRNLEDPKDEKDGEDEEIDPLDEDDESDEATKNHSDEGEEENDEPVKEKWQPKENDPLDEEDEDSDEESEGRSGEREEESENRETEEESDEISESKVRRSDVSDEADMPEDSTRETLESEEEFERPARGESEPDTLDDLAEKSPMGKAHEEEDEYFIPNLKGSRQSEGNVSYNTAPQRGSLGESYSPRENYMEGNDPNNFFSQHQQPQPPKRANKFHLLVLVLIGIAVIGFTVYILKGGFGNINLGTSTPSPSPSALPSVEPTPTPTPEPDIERGNFTVRVLNGTDTTGLARTVSDKLKEAGYKTANPGNASEDDVEQTEIRVKEGTQSAALLQRLTLDLAPDYEAVEGDNLDEKAAYDAEVIIGAK